MFFLAWKFYDSTAREENSLNDMINCALLQLDVRILGRQHNLNSYAKTFWSLANFFQNLSARILPNECYRYLVIISAPLIMR